MSEETQKDWIILKLGGSLLCDKAVPYSLNSNIIQNLISQIKEFCDNSDQKLIIVHGGGSFGHPTAKKYAIHEGINPNYSNQIFGLIQTHLNMQKLNLHIVNAFQEASVNAYSISTSNVFIETIDKLNFTAISLIEELIGFNIIPVLYGDILFVQPHDFRILSGDRIITTLCGIFYPKISKIIFATNVDGLFTNWNDESKKTLVTEISGPKLEQLNLDSLQNSEKKIDVTGEMQGKIREILKISNLGIPVEICNGQEPQRVIKALRNEKILSTKIYP